MLEYNPTKCRASRFSSLFFWVFSLAGKQKWCFCHLFIQRWLLDAHTKWKINRQNHFGVCLFPKQPMLQQAHTSTGPKTASQLTQFKLHPNIITIIIQDIYLPLPLTYMDICFQFSVNNSYFSLFNSILLYMHKTYITLLCPDTLHAL